MHSSFRPELAHGARGHSASLLIAGGKGNSDPPPFYIHHVLRYWRYRENKLDEFLTKCHQINHELKVPESYISMYMFACLISKSKHFGGRILYFVRSNFH